MFTYFTSRLSFTKHNEALSWVRVVAKVKVRGLLYLLYKATDHYWCYLCVCFWTGGGVEVTFFLKMCKLPKRWVHIKQWPHGQARSFAPSLKPPPPPSLSSPTHTHIHTHTHTHTPFFLMVSICLVSVIHSLSIAMNEWVSGGNALRLYVLPKSWWVDLLLQRCYGCCVRVPFSTLALRGQFRTCVCACALSVIPRKEKGWVVVMWGGGVLSYLSPFHDFVHLIFLFRSCDASDWKTFVGCFIFQICYWIKVFIKYVYIIIVSK